MRDLVLGLDTSNYTTSVAVTDVRTREILADERVLLTVKSGEKGLRQSDALFQHWNNLPVLLERVLPRFGAELKAVAVSDRPRAQEGSYMPVFTAGVNAARILAAQTGAKLLFCSHQEGHIRARIRRIGGDTDRDNAHQGHDCHQHDQRDIRMRAGSAAFRLIRHEETFTSRRVGEK